MAVWAAQNALMAAYHSGSPCPELAAVAAVGGSWGLGAGKKRRCRLGQLCGGVN